MRETRNCARQAPFCIPARRPKGEVVPAASTAIRLTLLGRRWGEGSSQLGNSGTQSTHNCTSTFKGDYKNALAVRDNPLLCQERAPIWGWASLTRLPCAEISRIVHVFLRSPRVCSPMPTASHRHFGYTGWIKVCGECV